MFPWFLVRLVATLVRPFGLKVISVGTIGRRGAPGSFIDTRLDGVICTHRVRHGYACAICDSDESTREDRDLDEHDEDRHVDDPNEERTSVDDDYVPKRRPTLTMAFDYDTGRCTVEDDKGGADSEAVRHLFGIFCHVANTQRAAFMLAEAELAASEANRRLSEARRDAMLSTRQPAASAR